MNNSSPFSATHHHPFSFYDEDILLPILDQLYHQSSVGAFHAPGSSASIHCPNHRSSGQLPHIISDNDDDIIRKTPPPPFLDQLYHRLSGGAFHAPGSSASILGPNHRPSGQLPHIISDDDDNIIHKTPPPPFPGQLYHQSSVGAFHAPGSSASIHCPNHRPSGQLPHIISDNDDDIIRKTPPPPFLDQLYHQLSGGAFHAPGSSASILGPNHRPSGQLPHIISDDDDNIIHKTPPPPFPGQLYHQLSGGAFHAPGSSTSIICPNHRPSGQLPHIIGGSGGHEYNNYNNLPDQLPSSTTFQPGQHIDPFVITANWIEDYSYLFDQQVDQDGLYSSNTDFDATPQSQYINHSEALLHGGGVVATQTYSEAKQMRQYKRWTNEEMSKLLVAIYEFRQSRYLWEDVKKNHFSERSTNTLKQKFKEMCKAATTSPGVKDPKTKELYYLALKLRGEIQQKKGVKKSFTGN